MPHDTKTHSLAHELSLADKARMEALAPLLDIEFLPQPNGKVRIRVTDCRGCQECEVSAELSHVRLLTELCSKVSRWVYFHPAQRAVDTLLRQPEAKLQRLAKLYARWKTDGYPL